MTGILVFFHCGSNIGYAVGRHEVTFADMALRLAGSFDELHFGYPNFKNGISSKLPEQLKNFIQFDSSSTNHSHLQQVKHYINNNNIQLAFGFDQKIKKKSYQYLRKGGVRWFISYWGAPMSSLYSQVILPLRKIQYRIKRGGPDHYIFQSEDMRRTATHGVGIPYHRTSVIRSGVDVETFKPTSEPTLYVHDMFDINRNRKVIYYSGHMEERKGIHVIIKAAVHLITSLQRKDLHFVFLGNKNGEEINFINLYKNTIAEDYITFAGYREDVANIQASSYLAVIASTGWDSHTMTAVEVAASGLPLLVSDLPGIREAVTDETGLLFTPGDFFDLAEKICIIADDQKMRDRLGEAARQRVLEGYTFEHQVRGLEEVVRKVTNNEFY